MPTARGQALANEYGIKFFETVSVYVVEWPHGETNQVICAVYLNHIGIKSIIITF